MLGGGVIGAVSFVIWQGPEFFGVGLPFGMLIGLIGFLTVYALVALPRMAAAGAAAVPTMEAWRSISLIGLFSAIVAHFTEIHFGIAIVSTRTHFWVYAGLMLVLGFILPNTGAAAEPTAVSAAPTKVRRRGRAATSTTNDEDKPWQEEWGPVLVGAAMIGTVLITLGFDFITNNTKSTQAVQILADSLTKLPSGGVNNTSFAIFGMMLITWLAGGALALLEETQGTSGRNMGGIIVAGLGMSAVVALVAWFTFAAHLAAIASFQPTNLDQLLNSANSVAATLTLFYVWVALIVLAMAAALDRAAWPPVQRALSQPRPRCEPTTRPLAVIAYVALPLLVIILSVFLNLADYPGRHRLQDRPAI